MGNCDFDTNIGDCRNNFVIKIVSTRVSYYPPQDRLLEPFNNPTQSEEMLPGNKELDRTEGYEEPIFVGSMTSSRRVGGGGSRLEEGWGEQD